jgi:hypothetical protein
LYVSDVLPWWTTTSRAPTVALAATVTLAMSDVGLAAFTEFTVTPAPKSTVAVESQDVAYPAMVTSVVRPW